MDLSLDKLHRRDSEATDFIYNVTEIFECFETGAACAHFRGICRWGPKFAHSDFNIPLIWLTILVIRSGSQSTLENVLKHLSSTRLLGKLRLDRIERLTPFKMSSAPDHNESSGPIDSLLHKIGYFLPNDVDL